MARWSVKLDFVSQVAATQVSFITILLSMVQYLVNAIRYQSVGLRDVIFLHCSSDILSFFCFVVL